jgi:hypothetical protein
MATRRIFDGATIEIGQVPIVGIPPTGTIVWFKVAGVWKQTTVWTKIAGVWKTTTPYIKIAGVWK